MVEPLAGQLAMEPLAALHSTAIAQEVKVEQSHGMANMEL